MEEPDPDSRRLRDRRRKGWASGLRPYSSRRQHYHRFRRRLYAFGSSSTVRFRSSLPQLHADIAVNVFVAHNDRNISPLIRAQTDPVRPARARSPDPPPAPARLRALPAAARAARCGGRSSPTCARHKARDDSRSRESRSSAGEAASAMTLFSQVIAVKFRLS